MEQLEFKITSELQQLRERIDTMSREIETYSDIDKLRADGEARKKVWLQTYSNEDKLREKEQYFEEGAVL